MTYIGYHIESTIIAVRAETERAAKASLTKYCKKVGDIRDDFAVADSATFHDKIEKMVERTNLMSDKKYMEPVNTPVYMSPSCDSYWSM